MDTWLHTLEQVLMPHCGFVQESDWPDCCNLNLYEGPESFTGMHADDEDMFQGKVGPITIISFSLGAARPFELWQAGKMIWRQHLYSGDLLAMEHFTQKFLKHAAPRVEPEAKDALCETRRVNLTWRWMAKHQRGAR